MLLERLEDAERRLEESCDEIIMLRSDLHDSSDVIDGLLAQQESLEEQLTAQREMFDGCNVEREVAISALQNAEIERVFWKACAERALRLWDRAQDELEARSKR